MRDESGKTPLGWIITIVISLVIAGVVVAMLFGDNSNMIKEYQNKNNTVQTQKK